MSQFHEWVVAQKASGKKKEDLIALVKSKNYPDSVVSIIESIYKTETVQAQKQEEKIRHRDDFERELKKEDEPLKAPKHYHNYNKVIYAVAFVVGLALLAFIVVYFISPMLTSQSSYDMDRNILVSYQTSEVLEADFIQLTDSYIEVGKDGKNTKVPFINDVNQIPVRVFIGEDLERIPPFNIASGDKIRVTSTIWLNNSRTINSILVLS